MISVKVFTCTSDNTCHASLQKAPAPNGCVRRLSLGPGRGGVFLKTHSVRREGQRDLVAEAGSGRCDIASEFIGSWCPGLSMLIKVSNLRSMILSSCFICLDGWEMGRAC